MSGHNIVHELSDKISELVEGKYMSEDGKYSITIWHVPDDQANVIIGGGSARIKRCGSGQQKYEAFIRKYHTDGCGAEELHYGQGQGKKRMDFCLVCKTGNIGKAASLSSIILPNFKFKNVVAKKDDEQRSKALEPVLNTYLRILKGAFQIERA